MSLRPRYTIRVADRKVELGRRTLVMGVLNVTPDSFSDGGLYFARASAIRRGLELARQGADWIDIGGESTRPGSRPISAEEELHRVLPVIRALARRLPDTPISIDSTKSDVAEAAVRAGASIINDVSGLRFDAEIARIAARYGTPLILMHLRGRPETMQRKPFARSVWRSVREGLAASIRRARALGVRRSQLIIDPGLGFGKSRHQSYELLAHLRRLHEFRLPLLVGTSRKSFVQAVAGGEGLDAPRSSKRARSLTAQSGYWKLLPSKRLATGAAAVPEALRIGDAAAVVASILASAHIVRVHDVASALPAVRIADALLEASAS
ncbi:MAG: dihydropteroate synthase [Acidobacteria bacterium]|nr:MAG: dihydropteroate synthase [Acidobacteriota bacterium]